MKKIAVLFVTFICFELISGSYANTSHDSQISYKNNGVLSTVLEKLISGNHELNIELPNNPSTGMNG